MSARVKRVKLSDDHTIHTYSDNNIPFLINPIPFDNGPKAGNSPFPKGASHPTSSRYTDNGKSPGNANKIQGQLQKMIPVRNISDESINSDCLNALKEIDPDGLCYDELSDASELLMLLSNLPNDDSNIENKKPQSDPIKAQVDSKILKVTSTVHTVSETGPISSNGSTSDDKIHHRSSDMKPLINVSIPRPSIVVATQQQTLQRPSQIAIIPSSSRISASHPVSINSQTKNNGLLFVTTPSSSCRNVTIGNHGNFVSQISKDSTVSCEVRQTDVTHENKMVQCGSSYIPAAIPLPVVVQSLPRIRHQYHERIYGLSEFGGTDATRNPRAPIPRPAQMILNRQAAN